MCSCLLVSDYLSDSLSIYLYHYKRLFSNISESSININTSNFSFKMTYVLIKYFSSNSELELSEARKDFDEFITKYPFRKCNFPKFINETLPLSVFEKDSDLYNDADINRQRWNDLMNGKIRTPSKDMLYKIAFSLQLTITQTQLLFSTKGYCINHNIFRESIFTFILIDPDGRTILEQPSYKRNKRINDLLEEYGEPYLYYR